MENQSTTEAGAVESSKAAAIDAKTSEVRSKRGGDRRSASFKARGGDTNVVLPARKAQEETVPPVSEETLQLWRGFISSFFKVVDGIVCRHVMGTVLTIDPQNKAMATLYMEKVHLQDEQIELFANSGAEIVRKHAALAAWGPELTFGLGITVYGGNVIAVKNELRQISQEIKAMRGIKAERDASTPSPN